MLPTLEQVPSQTLPRSKVPSASGSERGGKDAVGQAEREHLCEADWRPEQKRTVTSLTPEELKFTNPRTPAGVTLLTAWKPP